AIERIEILTDSASAVYGADAIGGVINFIMRADYTGAEIQVGMTRPEAKGADEEQVKALFGAAGDRGKIIASFEFFERKAIFDGDRDYSAVQINGDSFGDTVGVSVGGNTGFPGNFSTAYPIG
ncbi:MAG: TonB-dependent receptor plug domain-containing protein, partial [Gemmatimonadetes bacterium]|nr:TonB-dependent receptor plug domain-containing protein [Gemmatimonadota bacterium]